MNSFNLFRFNTLFGLHQKATAFGPYKWWSERRYSGHVHLAVLVLYMVGLFSGLYLTLPKNSEAAYAVPQRAIYSNLGQDVYSFDLSTGQESAAVSMVWNQTVPAIYGNKVVWQDDRNSATTGTDIYMKNLTTGAESAVTTSAGDQYNPVIYGDIVVWQDTRNAATTGTDIYMKNLTTGVESAVTTATGEQTTPVIYGDIVAWQDGRNSATTGSDIYMKNLTTGVKSAVTTAAGDQTAPVIYGDKVVWQDTRNTATTGTDIYMKNLTTGVESAVTTASGEQTAPAIYGETVVWQDSRDLATTGNDIYTKNLTTSIESAVTTALGDQISPKIYNDIVVWQDSRNSTTTGADIYMKNLTTGVESTVTVATGDQYSPVIYGSNIIWQDGRNNLSASTPRIYGDRSVFYNGMVGSGAYLVNNITGQKTLLAKYGSSPVIYGDAAVWQDERNSATTGTDIYMKNLVTEVESVVTTSAGNQRYPSIYGNVVVWQDDRNSATTGTDIYMKNLATGVESAVTTAAGEQYNPVIYGDNVVWQDTRNSATTGTDIYMKNLTTGVESAVTVAAGEQYTPQIYGNAVVWADERNSMTTGVDIYMKDITTGVESAVTTAANDQTAPVIYGNNVVWTDYRDAATTGADIYMKNISVGVELAVATATGDQYSPSIYGEKIVWEDYRNGYSQMYLANLDKTPPTFENLSGSNHKINLTDGQVIRKSPLSVQTKPVDPDSGVYKVEYYIDNKLVATVNTPNPSGVYAADIDLNSISNRAGGVTFKALAYDGVGNVASYVVNVVLDPWFFPYGTVSPSSQGYSTGPSIQYRPAVFGDIAAWEDTRNSATSGYDIYMKNLTTGMESAVVTAPGAQTHPAIYGDIIVWQDDRNSATTGTDIYMKNLTTGVESAVTTTAGNQSVPAIYGNIVVWQDDRNFATTGNDIYMKNLTTGVESAVTTASGDQLYPAIYGNIVVWQDSRNSATTGSDIYMKNLTTGAESVVTTATGDQSYPKIYDNIAVWQDARNYSSTNNDIYMKNLNTSVESLVTTAAGSQESPTIYGNRIAWSDNRNNATNDYDVYYYDLTKGTEVPLLTQTYREHDVAIGQTALVFCDHVLGFSGGSRTGYYIFPVSNREAPIDIFAPEQLALSPTNGTTGDGLNINVTAWDNDAPVRAEISVDGVASVSIPKTGAAASPDGIGHTGTFTGSITMPNKTSASFVLKVYDVAGNVATKTGTFAIVDNDVPTVTSVEPLAATTGDPLTLNIKSADNIAVTKLQISVNGAAYVDVIGASYPLNVPLDSIVDIKVKVKASDAAGNTVESQEYAVKVTDNKTPAITDFTTPTEVTAEKNTITVTATDNIAPVRATISFDGVIWQDMLGVASPFTYVVPVSDLKPGQSIEYFVRVYDAAGNFATTEKEKTVYTAAPAKPSQVSTETVAEKIAQSLRTFFVGPKGVGTKVLGALTNVTDTAVQVIKATPPAVANTFPYILFILLGIMATIFFFQAQSEARQSKKLLDILTMERAIYEDKENFLTLSAHYLRTPATIITGGVDSLAGKYKAKLAPIAKSLTDEIQTILKSIENNSYLAHIKKPELEKEKRYLFLSPFLIVPILLVAATAVIANLLFIKVAEINISTINLLVEILSFMIAVQVLVTLARHRYTEQRNRREFEQTLSYERSMDRARNKFVDEVGTKIAPYIAEIDNNTPKTKDKMVESIREGKHRLSDILYKFSLLSESTKGGFRLIHPAFVSLKTQAKVTLGIHEKDIAAKQLKIKEDLGDIQLKTDPRKIEFIMSSLISNAVKFTKPKTKVGISATKSGKKTNIIISDEGPGISEEGKLHLFKPFTRTTSALQFDYEGFGLSLYLSKILVNSMGGDIYLESEVGKGTTVRVEV